MLQLEGYVRFGEGSLAEPYAQLVASWLQERGHPALAVTDPEDPTGKRWVVYWKPDVVFGRTGPASPETP
ncbi:MAG: hypothetical protein D6685_02480 [Bacteroidetes bacterium]|nr:hypothetical protein AWN76_009095 [Rhodothermaceae bacterium RA]RMH68229.1 MAG: hypothetical protein D6685_02480 [Bacteroidota bacterium]